MHELNQAYPPEVLGAEAWVDRWGGADASCGFDPSKRQHCDLWMIPQRVDVQVLFYNKGIFEAEGVRRQFSSKTGRDLQLPETWDDYARVAKGLHGLSYRGGSVIGCAETLGKTHYAFEFFAARFWSMLSAETGNPPDFFDVKMGRYAPTFNGQAGLRAIRHLRSLRPYWAPGSEQAAHGNTIRAFAQGSVALCPQWYTFAADTSLTYALGERLGITLLPGTRGLDQTVNRTPSIGGGGLAIPKNARDKQKAWAAIRYLTSEEFCEAAAMKGATVARPSVYRNPDIRSRNPWTDVYLESISRSVARPRMQEFVMAEAIIGQTISDAVLADRDEIAIDVINRGAIRMEPLLANIRTSVKQVGF
jgi:multiple sugar transport system substrate-binding protein